MHELMTRQHISKKLEDHISTHSVVHYVEWAMYIKGEGVYLVKDGGMWDIFWGSLEGEKSHAEKLQNDVIHLLEYILSETDKLSESEKSQITANIQHHESLRYFLIPNPRLNEKIHAYGIRVSEMVREILRTKMKTAQIRLLSYEQIQTLSVSTRHTISPHALQVTENLRKARLI